MTSTPLLRCEPASAQDANRAFRNSKTGNRKVPRLHFWITKEFQFSRICRARIYSDAARVRFSFRFRRMRSASIAAGINERTITAKITQ